MSNLPFDTLLFKVTLLFSFVVAASFKRGLSSTNSMSSLFNILIKFVIEGTNPDPEGHNFVFVVLIVLMAGPAGLQVLMSVYGVVTNGNGYV